MNCQPPGPTPALCFKGSKTVKQTPASMQKNELKTSPEAAAGRKQHRGSDYLSGAYVHPEERLPKS